MSYKQIKNLDRRIKKIEEEQELKFIEYAIAEREIPGSDTFSSISPVVQHFTAINQGDDFFERIGRTINVTSLHMNMFFSNPGSLLVSGDVFANVRVIVFRWKDSNGTSSNPVLSDFLRPPNSNNIFPNDRTLNTMAFYNIHNHSSFKVYYDNTFDLTNYLYDDRTTPDTYTNPGKATHRITLKIPLGFQVNYGEGTRPLDNELFCYMYSDSSVSPHPVVWSVGRLYYKDS